MSPEQKNDITSTLMHVNGVNAPPVHTRLQVFVSPRSPSRAGAGMPETAGTAARTGRERRERA
jgi:hypothetical protein